MANNVRQPMRSAKFNGLVRRSNRTHREQFYKAPDIDLFFDEHNLRLEKWQDVYNFIQLGQPFPHLKPTNLSGSRNGKIPGKIFFGCEELFFSLDRIK